MKGFKKWSPMCLPLALIAGVVIGWWIIQQSSITPSEAQMTPGPQPPGPQAKLLPPKLPASPPSQAEEMGPPPDPTLRKRPTRESLLEKIRQMPGGPEMIEEARRRGARIGMAKPVEPEPSLSWMNPFRVEKAEATGTFSLTLEPSNNWSSISPFGAVNFYGAATGASYSSTTFCLYIVSSTLTGTQVTHPSLSFAFEAPSDDWYIVNIEAWWINIPNATLKHSEGGTYPVVKTWAYGGKTGPTQSYPALLELTAGYHSFYWLPSSSVYVYEVDVYSI